MMLIALASLNVAIALLCFLLSWWVMGIYRQVTQLNRDLSRWLTFAATDLTNYPLALTYQRTQLRQWQLGHLKWQLQQRRLGQLTKILQLIWFMRQWRRPSSP